MESQLQQEMNPPSAPDSTVHAPMGKKDAQSQRIQLIEFRLGTECYALPIDDIKEVVLTPSIAKVPQAAAHVLGVANIRGTIITIIDLEARIGAKRTSMESTHAYRYTLVLEMNGVKVGVLVEQVPNTRIAEEEDISGIDEGVSSYLSGSEGSFLKGILKTEEKLVFLLDIHALLI